MVAGAFCLLGAGVYMFVIEEIKPLAEAETPKAA
jgi:hypothetical protein